MTWHLHFANDFLLLTADRSDFLNKIPEHLINELKYFTVIDTQYKSRTYYLIEYSF